MCLLITLAAAVVSTVVWYAMAPKDLYKVSILCLMYWGASLMWLVDGFYSVAAGGPFLDLSANDALLGFTVVLCGLAAWVLLLLCRDPKKVFRSVFRSDGSAGSRRRS